jgi:hypothetical protein
MTKSSCIEHLPNQQLVIIREDYVALCEEGASADAPIDPNCAAALLNLFEHFTNWKKENSQQSKKYNDTSEVGGQERTQDESLWIWKTTDDLQTDLMGIWGKTKIETARKWLVSKGFIRQRRNPHHNWDKTYQYFYDIEGVNSSLRKLKNKTAIPEITSKTKNTKNVPAKLEQARAPQLPTVVHFKDATCNWHGDKHVYIGRENPHNSLAASIWANPFEVTTDQTREEAIARYRDYILNSPELMAKLPNLMGKTLVCWCKPEACHGDVLVDLLHEYLVRSSSALCTICGKASGHHTPECTLCPGCNLLKSHHSQDGYPVDNARKMAKEHGLDDSNDVFANKNKSGDSVPILDDICPVCANISHSIVDANGISERICKCQVDKTAPDNPNDNPNLSQLERSILAIANRPATMRVSHKVFGEIGQHMTLLKYKNLLKQYKHLKRSYVITDQGKQWLLDNPSDAPVGDIEGLKVHTEIPKKRTKRKYERKLESLSPDVIPIAEALANCRHGSSFNNVLNGRREGIKKIAEKMRDDGLTANDVETIQAYFEHRAKEQPEGEKVWLKCNYDTYYKHAQDALDWKKSAPAKAGNDGIRIAHIVSDDDESY